MLLKKETIFLHNTTQHNKTKQNNEKVGERNTKLEGKRRTIELTSKQNKQTRRLRYYYFLLLLCTIPVRVPDRENCIYR